MGHYHRSWLVCHARRTPSGRVKNQILNVKSYQRVVQFAADLVAPKARKQWYSLQRTGWYCFPRNEWYGLKVFCKKTSF